MYETDDKLGHHPNFADNCSFHQSDLDFRLIDKFQEAPSILFVDHKTKIEQWRGHSTRQYMRKYILTAHPEIGYHTFFANHFKPHFPVRFHTIASK